MRFHEKPTHAVAQEYMRCDTILWNIGMVAGKLSVFFDAFKSVASTLYAHMQEVNAKIGDYKELPSISFDHAVLEKYQHIWVVPTTISWCDVGNVNSLLTVAAAHHIQGPQIAWDAHDNMAHVPGKLVALVGVDNLCIIDTPDVLLIAHRAHVESVKAVVAQLKTMGLEQYL